jgi:flagellar assembly protein FliH
MTSSRKAISQASVRGTPGATVLSVGVWTLNELAVPSLSDLAPVSRATPVAALSPADRARLIDEGYAHGLADGERKGRAAAQTGVTQALAVINEIATQLREAAAFAPGVVEENIAALVVIVARQIVSHEVSAKPELVADLVRRALTEFPIEQSVRIRVHPLDLSLLTLSGLDPDAAPITGTRDASWLADARIGRGGCLVEGRDRIVDGRVDAALERAYRRMAVVDAT